MCGRRTGFCKKRKKADISSCKGYNLPFYFWRALRPTTWWHQMTKNGQKFNKIYLGFLNTTPQCGKIENQRLKSLPGQLQLFYDFFFLMCSLEVFNDKLGFILISQQFPLCSVAIKLSSHTQILILAHFYYHFLKFLCK